MPVINTILITVWHNKMNRWLRSNARNQNTPKDDSWIIVDDSEWSKLNNNLSKDVIKWTD
ncbi:MAG: hypothetical protein EBU90_26875 [Proteobacteria bacterium]|nr:hypothetical protein [Pseudomonadota bacterium]